ncbi:MAG: CARDB domain-containing protein, partial [Candidatus Cloacimonadaceae bacterium]|nr:CARDB domain-containing protein [Candidatus Cloacimonadaceae bacterium]
LSPEDGATGLAIEGFDLNWAAALTGGNPVDYAVFMSQNEANLYGDHYWDGITDTRFDPTQAALGPISYNYGETWYWTVMAFNGDGDAIQETPFSFTIMDDPRILSLPYSQNFDGVPSDSMPVAWTGYVDATSTYAYVRTSTSYSVSAPNSMYLTNSNDAAADLRLITPDILVPMNSIKLSFSARGSSGYTLLIGTVDALDGTGTFSQMASIDLTSTHTIYTVSFADYVGTDQNICFKHGLGGTYRSIYIDDVQMDQLVANDLAVTAFSGDSMGIAGDELSYNVSVYNNGTAEQNAYAIQLLSMPTGQLLASLNVADPVPLAAGDTAEHVINWTPTSAGVYEVYAKVVLAGDVNDYNDASDILTVGVYAATSYIPFIGDAESSSTTNYMPFNVWYKNSVAETIYMAHEMQMASGTINAIIYYNTFTQDVNIPVKIWMAHSTETVNSAWLPFENYSLVFDGTVLFPQGVNAVVIPLQTPFEYTGGNLAVRTNRVMDTQYYSSSDKFYYTSDSSYPNRSRYYYNDTTVMDPTDPILTNNGTQSSYIPNTAFIVAPYTALPPLSAPAVQIELSDTNPQLSWEAVAGAYEYVIYGSDDPHNWAEATEIGTTTDLDYTVYSAPAMKFYKVAARSYNHQIREIGQVFNPAAVIGFDNSSLKNMPKTIGTENKD